MDHTFCRMLYRESVVDAKKEGITFKGITAIKTSSFGMRLCYFVECPGRSSEYVTAHCAADAKSKYINRLLEQKGEIK
jgi:hypothetical protein